MFLFVIGVIIMLAAIGAIALGVKARKTKFTAMGAIVAVLGIAVIICSSLSTVPTGHTGILTTFGKVEDVSLPNGVNIHAPWQNVITMSNKEQKDSGKGLAFSKDIQEVSYSYTIQHMLQPPTYTRTLARSTSTSLSAPRSTQSSRPTSARQTPRA